MTKAQLKYELNKCKNMISSARVDLDVAQSKIGTDANSDKFNKEAGELRAAIRVLCAKRDSLNKRIKAAGR
jgi:uncharacterized coiled-coil DUF342 family protein